LSKVNKVNKDYGVIPPCGPILEESGELTASSFVLSFQINPRAFKKIS